MAFSDPVDKYDVVVFSSCGIIFYISLLNPAKKASETNFSGLKFFYY